MEPYVFQRGETIGLGIDVVAGDAAGAAVSAALRRVAGFTLAGPAMAFAVAARAADGADPGGWTLTLAAEASAALAAGLYRADARIVTAGGVTITDPIDIRIVEPVSA